MSHDFAKKSKASGPRKGARPRANSGPPARTQTPGWVWMLTGMAAGVFISFLVFLTMPQSGQEAPGPKPVSKDREPAENSPAAKRPHFDFYTLLPESELIVSENKPTSDPETAPAATENTRYLLQAGAFQTHREADRHRAQLLLLGMDARIEKVTVRGNETWHRVQVGPFSDRSALSSARGRLLEQGIDTLLIQQK